MKPEFFSKRPVVIQAVQLTWASWNAVCDFVGEKAFREGFIGGIKQPDGTYVWGEPARPYDGCEIAASIPTLEGTFIANEGDWIVKGIKGELYPVKPDIFEETYERYETPSPGQA